MKRILKNFALMAVAALGAVACTETDVEEAVAAPENYNAITLYATTPSGDTTTKVEFAENDDDDNISLSWELGDTFIVYEYQNNELCGTFECTDAENGEFTSVGTHIMSLEGRYTAMYNLGVDITSQDGDKIANLDDACYMTADFYYNGEDEAIAFQHQMAIMTFQFKSEDRPAKLVFENGDESYTVNYSTIEPENGLYTSHIMINPCDDTARTLTFTLYDADGTAYDIRTVDTSKAYTAGKRYTSPVSDLENAVWSGEGTESSPYLIENGAQLRTLSSKVAEGEKYAGKYFEMTGNIDLGGIDSSGNGIEGKEFAAIGSSSSIYFSGNFNGAGYKVSGLYINDSTASYQALFGYIYEATIENLGVSGSVTANGTVGGLVGRAGADVKASYSSKITNCYSEVSVTASSNYAGGVVASAQYTSITSCYNAGSVKSNASYSYAGGVVGSTSVCRVISCYNTGQVEGNNYTGGVAGQPSSSIVTGCYNVGAITSICYNAGSVVGRVMNSSTVTSNYYLAGTYTYGIGDDSQGAGEAKGEATSMTSDEMQAASFVTTLNNAAYIYNNDETYDLYPNVCGWQAVSGGYPVFDYDADPTYTEPGVYYNESTGIYEISSATALREFAALVNSGSNTIKGQLMNDIDLGGINGDGNGIEGKEFTPIGSSSTIFKGTFNGAGFKVSGLYINDSESDYQALFGYVYNATIENLGVSGSVTGSQWTGGLVGYASSSSVTECYSDATVTGAEKYIGGVVGYVSSSSITSCYNTGNVACTLDNDSESNYLGGVVGYVSGSRIVSCYNSGTVSGIGDRVGGIVGYVVSSSLVTGCYNVGAVSSKVTYNIGSVVGWLYSGTVTSNYYLAGTYSKGFGYDSTSAGEATEKTSTEMQVDNFVLALNNAAYTYNNDATYASYPDACAWQAVSGGYPVFDYTAAPTYTETETGIYYNETSGYYEISTATALREFATLVNGGSDSINGQLMNDIDLGGIAENGDGIEGKEFTPIGSSTTTFKGTFKGAGFKVSGLYINDSTADYQALFGAVDGATIENLGVSGSVAGNNYVGSLVGHATASLITECYSDATVTGERSYVGGVVGRSDTSTIISCYNTGAVCNITTNIYLGGIVGFINNSRVVSCYNSGKVSGKYYHVGGIVGYMTTYSLVTACYNAGVVSSDSSSYVGSVVGWLVGGTVTSNYYLAGTHTTGIGDISSLLTGEATEKSTAEMQAASFVTTLNNAAYTYNNDDSYAAYPDACAWAADDATDPINSGYPVFDYDGVPAYTVTIDAGLPN